MIRRYEVWRVLGLVMFILSEGSASHIPTVAWAEVYSWVDPDGATHFSDTPPPAGAPHTRRQMSKTERPLFQKARELAMMWYHASPYGGRCDIADMQRIERLYHDVWNEAQREFMLCLDGWAPSCRQLDIPQHLAIANGVGWLRETYLPPADIRQLKESGYQNNRNSWRCP